MGRGRWVAAGGAVVVVAAVVAVVALAGRSRPASAQTGTSTTGPSTTGTGTTGAGAAPGAPIRTITVSGDGTASGRPDTATVQLGVQVRAAKATAALEAANGKAQQLLDTLKISGVKPDDITTTNVSLYAQTANDGHTVTGYEAGNTVMAKIRDVGRAGVIIDAAAASVGDDISLQGVSFSIDDTGAMRAAARREAVAAAKAQAEQLASASGRHVGSIISLSEGTTAPPPLAYAAGTVPAADAGSRVPLEPGQQQLDVAVTVVYELV